MAKSNQNRSTGEKPEESAPQSQTAVWYFVGAVFAFTLPGMLFDDVSEWVRILFFVVGLIAMVAGFVQLRREFRAKRRELREKN